MIDVDYNGRFGNRLFQYFTSVILAENHGHSIANPLSTSIDKLKYNYEEEANTSDRIEVNDENYNAFINSKNCCSSNMHVVGYFQKKEIITKFKHRKKKLFNDVGEKDPIKGTYIHLRLGDILDTPGKYCELDYYEKALEQVDLSGELALSSDTPNHTFVETLMSKYNFNFLNLNEEETILKASQFDNKILSLGTFSWWIGFLGNQKNVICPNPTDYIRWHGKIFPFLNWKTCSPK